MRQVIQVICIAVIISACGQTGPSEGDIQTAIAKTHVAQPTNTLLPTLTKEPTATTIPTPTIEPSPTLMPLSEIDLSPLLIQEGDLPAGYSGAQIISPSDGKHANLAIYSIYQQLEYQNDSGGSVIVYIFDNEDDPILVIEDEYGELEVEEVEGLGEKAVAYSMDMDMGVLGVWENAMVSFVRCNTYVRILFDGTTDTSKGIGYARRLDERLQSVICREQ